MRAPARHSPLHRDCAQRHTGRLRQLSALPLYRPVHPAWPRSPTRWPTCQSRLRWIPPFGGPKPRIPRYTCPPRQALPLTRASIATLRPPRPPDLTIKGRTAKTVCKAASKTANRRTRMETKHARRWRSRASRAAAAISSAMAA